MIWFSSDFHFGHKKILIHQPHRNFISIEEMDTHLIDQINKYVQRRDILYVLGDFAFGSYGYYRQRLNVKELHVITGNHDTSVLRNHVSSMHDMAYKKFNGINFHLCHYPLMSWRNKEHGSIHLYGHTHGSIEARMNELWPARRSLDVGLDNSYFLFGEFRPFNVEEIIEKFT